MTKKSTDSSSADHAADRSALDELCAARDALRTARTYFDAALSALNTSTTPTINNLAAYADAIATREAEYFVLAALSATTRAASFADVAVNTASLVGADVEDED